MFTVQFHTLDLFGLRSKMCGKWTRSHHWRFRFVNYKHTKLAHLYWISLWNLTVFFSYLFWFLYIFLRSIHSLFRFLFIIFHSSPFPDAVSHTDTHLVCYLLALRSIFSKPFNRMKNEWLECCLFMLSEVDERWAFFIFRGYRSFHVEK